MDHQVILLDIEGTVCPISFVKDVLHLSIGQIASGGRWGLCIVAFPTNGSAKDIYWHEDMTTQCPSGTTASLSQPPQACLLVKPFARNHPFPDYFRLAVLLVNETRHYRGFALDVSIQFPFALSALPATLATQWDAPSFQQYRDAFPAEHRASPEAFSTHVQDLMARDLKIPYLKALQGYLWTRGYEEGALVCPLFPDVEPKLKEWHSAGKTIIIYSSGSVPAQKLLFQYTNGTPADLRPLISNYFDTVNAGPKTAKQSYATIAATLPEVSIDRWLFLSDNVKEVVAAKEAGMKSFVVVRKGNAPLTESEREGQVLVESFGEVDLE